QALLPALKLAHACNHALAAVRDLARGFVFPRDVGESVTAVVHLRGIFQRVADAVRQSRVADENLGHARFLSTGESNLQAKRFPPGPRMPGSGGGALPSSIGTKLLKASSGPGPPGVG